jgi:hypothetical protein
MTEATVEDLLRQAAELVVQALRETEARCAVLGHHIGDCEARGSRTAAWNDAVRELRTLQDYRAGLMHRHSLIQQALDHPAGESPTEVPLQPVPNQGARRTQRQIQIRARRRS